VAIQIEERFVVRAPVEPVWSYLVDPRCVVTCVPGGDLERVLDDRTFDGTVRVAAGPFTFAYGGRIRLDEVDPAARHVRILGDAREAAGSDRARLTLESDLAPLPDGATEVVAHASVDVEGRIVEIGRPVLEELAHVVFQDFASRVRARIEAEQAGGATQATATGASAPLRVIPLVLRAIRAWMGGRLRPAAAGEARNHDGRHARDPIAQTREE
jgi:carbon monoxide dehydrogenase subunit G